MEHSGMIYFFLSLLVSLTYSALTPDEINTLVALHNNARATATPTPASPLPPLVWDNTILTYTQNWVNQCKKTYSQRYYSTLYGESALIFNPAVDVNMAFDYWYSQKASFNFATGACSGATCRNYVQIVARTATQFACASAKCSFGVFFVCDYRRYAQYTGVLPYTPAVAPLSTTTTTGAVASTTTSIATISTAAATTSATTASAATTSTSGKIATTSTTATTAAATTTTTTTTTSKPTTTTTTTSTTTTTTSKPTTTTTTAKATTGTTGSSSAFASIDYRGTPAVVRVKDQGSCGSCWAFCATAIVEGAVGLKRNVSSLSDQDTLDCSTGGSCNGGWPTTALNGIIRQGGLNTQSSYPYRVAQGTCTHTAANNGGSITRTGTTKGDFASIYNGLKTYGPVGIAVFADDSWFSYRSGVISSTATTVNHAVTIVGYDAGLNAWIIRNSWGTSWGQSGYAYLSATNPAAAQVYGAFYAVAA